ncbi:MAG: hypothetical protein LH614_15140 [Pyrinomonadaceae bacterium]|nr:hypothetical protein [Pyrinomonadaceae bacterium]
MVKKAAVAAKDAADQTRKTISQNLLLSNVHTCIKNLEEIQAFVRYERYESAQIRTSDLVSLFISDTTKNQEFTTNY